jgi:TRAP-type C4-dicarboxylate transport system substrate-binding protein
MAVGRRTFLASTTVALAAPAFLRAARGEAAHITLKLHHASSAVSCVHANFLAPWVRKIEAQSNGRLRIDIFPSMLLGGEPAQLFDQARDRVADIVWAMPSKTPGRFPRIEVFELPFVSSARALVGSEAIEDFAGDFLKAEFREVRPLCFSCADRGILHTHRSVDTVSAIHGLRLDVRTRFAGQAMEVLGGSAVPMPSGQLPLAIARRVVDGCIVPWDMVPALKLDELLKAHTDFAGYALSTTTYVLAMNETSYASLSTDLKKVIDDNAGQVAACMAGTMWDLKARAVADALSQNGDAIVTLAPDAVAHWRKATEPVIAAWRKQMKSRNIDGEKLLSTVHALLEKYASTPEPQPPAPPQPAQPPANAATKASQPARVAKPSPAAASKVTVATPAPQNAPKPSTPVTHWWQFWKSAPAPAPATASATPAASPPAEATHWWQFWKSASAPSPATVSAAPATTPAMPPAQHPAAAVAKPAPITAPAPPPKALNIPL